MSLVQRKILTEGRFGQEGLGLKPVSYSGSNTDGLTGELLKTSCCFCAAVFVETSQTRKADFQGPGKVEGAPRAATAGGFSISAVLLRPGGNPSCQFHDESPVVVFGSGQESQEVAAMSVFVL